MQYVIMRKNVPITVADFSDEGRMLWCSKEVYNEDYAPLWENQAADRFFRWWEERSVPIGQNHLQEVLREKGLVAPEEYLLKNLGLSLTDYYWIKPFDSPLTWEDVNLFQNDFANEIEVESIKVNNSSREYFQYVPNSSLQGQLDKKWIINDGKRYLVKGNRDETSAESINEVIATYLHESQGYDNYTSYELIKIKNKEYDYGCISPCFTSEKKELISAYGVVTSQKQKNDISSYEHFIHVCGMHGIDKEILRRDLEYQIQIDFILSGRDRHLNNISILRDADTLEFLRMAPIYDSGKCLFVGEAVPREEKELLGIKTSSFAGNELKLMEYVTDRSLVDTTKLPGTILFEKLYAKDSQMDERRMKLICEAYEKKIDLYRRFQLGQDLKMIKIKKPVKQVQPTSKAPKL